MNKPTFEQLQESCLFCDPAAHGQAENVILRSNRFYLFAGLGPILEGYILIVPYRCDSVTVRARSIAELPLSWIDELAFLRFIVSRFHVDCYDHPGLVFEHGRAGSCVGGSGSTQHCYHAHLCCYPGIKGTRTGLTGENDRDCLWTDFSRFTVARVAGLHELPTVVGSCPYLYISHQLAAPGESQELSAAVLLGAEHQLDTQALRRALANRVGKAESWNWRTNPDVAAAISCRDRFRKWLRENCDLAAKWEGDMPIIDFSAALRQMNVSGNSRISNQFFQRSQGVLQHRAVGRFLAQIPERTESDGTKRSPTILDVGCGPGFYSRLFADLGMVCTALDSSTEMLALARSHAGVPVRYLQKDILVDQVDERFDAIWASALLLHFSRNDLPRVVQKLAFLLSSDGVLYISTRTGLGVEFRREGRVFFLYAENELLASFHSAGLGVIQTWNDETHQGTTGDLRRKTWGHYLLQFDSNTTGQKHDEK